MSKILVNFIQDRSGSMQSVWDETLNGYKQFVKSLKEGDKGVEYAFTLTTFDTVVETPISGKNIADVSEDVLSKHGPRGSTALYDAVGATLKNSESIQADKYIVVIVTDGHENSSREWSKDALQKAIESRLSQGNWTFTYLGTQPETWDDAAALGVSAASTASYTPTMAHAAYAATACAVRSLSASASMGTRSMMRDHLSDSQASAAGMRKKPFRSSSASSKSSGRRWR